MSNNQTEILKSEIAELLKRVPPSVTGGSVQTVRQFKDAVDAAKKAANGSKSTILAMQQAAAKLRSFY